MRPSLSFSLAAVLLQICEVSNGFHVSTAATPQLQLAQHGRSASKSKLSAESDARGAKESVTRSKAIRQVLGGLLASGTLLVRTGESQALESDEFEEIFNEEALGLELEDVRYKGSSRVLIKRVIPGSPAASRSRIKADFVLVSANGEDLERQSASAAKKIIKNSSRPLTLVLRDTSIFQQLLKSEKTPLSASAENGGVAANDGGFEAISTRVSPTGVGREEQVIKLIRSDKSAGCEFCGQGARRGDLLEIEYTGKLANGKVFDGSSIKVNGQEVVGRGGDKTLFFVLGKQPKGQFPPGWDLLLFGMCVGESRLISVPPLLGYGEQGMPRRGVPPNATLLYDVKLIGVNAVNMCMA